jgi:hypothetical protein
MIAAPLVASTNDCGPQLGMALLKAGKRGFQRFCFDIAIKPENDGNAECACEPLSKTPEKIFDRTEEDGFQQLG